MKCYLILTNLLLHQGTAGYKSFDDLTYTACRDISSQADSLYFFHPCLENLPLMYVYMFYVWHFAIIVVPLSPPRGFENFSEFRSVFLFVKKSTENKRNSQSSWVQQLLKDLWYDRTNVRSTSHVLLATPLCAELLNIETLRYSEITFVSGL